MKALISTVLLAVLLLVGYSQVDGNETQRALFTGNSYTSSNDLPVMVADVHGDNGINLEVESITPGGTSLTQHAADPAVRSAILQGNFNFVILQDQSETPAISHLLADSSVPAAEALGELATESGARVIMFETWGHRNGSQNSGHRSFESMQAALTSGYRLMASSSGGIVAPVGSTWARSLKASDVALHQSDGSHPTLAGSHLASLVIAPTLLGEPLTSAPTNGVPDTDAARIVDLLW